MGHGRDGAQRTHWGPSATPCLSAPPMIRSEAPESTLNVAVCPNSPPPPTPATTFGPAGHEAHRRPPRLCLWLQDRGLQERPPGECWARPRWRKRRDGLPRAEKLRQGAEAVAPGPAGSGARLRRCCAALLVERLRAARRQGCAVSARAASNFRRCCPWLSEPQGELRLDTGATRALLAHSSLFPAGVMHVSGKFDAQDAVRHQPTRAAVPARLHRPALPCQLGCPPLTDYRPPARPLRLRLQVCICDSEGRELARGLANYSAEELQRLRGKSSQDFEVRADSVRGLAGAASQFQHLRAGSPSCAHLTPCL